MKTILTLCAAMLLFTQSPISARDIAAPPEEPTMTPDVMPSFKGGELYHFRAWLNSQMVYPKKALGKGNAEVQVSFIIEKDGKLSGIEILDSPDELFSKEVIRALKKSPRWEPGTVNGAAARVKLNMPATFLLPGEFPTPEGKKVDVAPTFQDGDLRTFTKWVLSQLALPALSSEPASVSTVTASVASGFPAEVKISDQSAVISWVVDETGRVTDIVVINSTNNLFSNEVVRVLKRSPQWTPGMIDGKPVRVVFTAPLTFKATQESNIRPL